MHIQENLMKLWQKLYILILLGILITVNIALYGIFHLTYQQNLKVEQNRTHSEFDVLKSNISANINELTIPTSKKTIAISTILESYETYYSRENINLEAWIGEKSIFPENAKHDVSKLEKNQITIERKNRHTTIWICSTIEADALTIYYSRPLTEMDQMWNRLTVYFALGSIGISIILALLLYIILRRGMRPMGKLTTAVNNIASGEFSTRISVTGNDEIAILGRGVNQMAETIEKSVNSLKQENQIRQSFIDNLTHELRTPLTSIYGFSEYLKRAHATLEDKDEAVSYIMSETKRMQDMTDVLMDLTRLRNKKIEMTNFNIHNIFQNIKVTENQLWLEKEIHITFSKENVTVYGNQILMEMLVRNLIHNSIHALVDKTCKQIKVQCYQKSSSVIITVKDNGCGISKEHIYRIKEPFYRVDKGRSRENGGAGLGLALCEQITTLHHGTLEYESNAEDGTTAILTLPQTSAMIES